MILNQKRGVHGNGMLLCLLFAVALAVGWPGNAAAAKKEKLQVLNTCGTLNRAPSVDPVGKSEGYATVLYDNRNGLPTSETNTIAQTGDGFIWIGCYAGLIRYDGNTFERIDSSGGIASVRRLYVDSRDRLWVGTNDTGFFLLSHDDIRKWDKADGLESVSIRVFSEDDEGVIYVGSTSGIAMIDQELRLTVLEDERIAGVHIYELRRGVDGLIYGMTADGDLFTLKGGKITFFLSHEDCRMGKAVAILPDPERPGVLYVGTDESVMYYGRLENNFASLGMKAIDPLAHVEKLEYIDGEVWICAANGIGKVDDLGFHLLKNVPMNNSIENIMTDNEGNLWFTSSRQGLMKIVPNRFSDLRERYNLPAGVVNTTCMYGRQLFIGTDTGLIVVEKERMLDALPLTEAITASGVRLETDDLLSFLDGVRIRSIMRDSQGRLWISIMRKYGLVCYDQGKITVFGPDDGLISDLVRTTSECEDGSLLVAQNGGLNIIRDGRVTAGYEQKDGLENVTVLTAMEGFYHEVILGTDGSGIYVIDGERMKHIGAEDGLSSEVIMRIRQSRDRDLYWIITSNSIAYMTPDFQVTTIRQFPYSNNYDLYENSKGDVWVISSGGLYVISKEELLESETPEPIFFGISSGLPYMATPNSFSELTAEGDLYIAGSSGVIKVNIENPFNDLGELKASLPFVDADGKRYYPDSTGSFRLPGNIRRLTIYPFVFSYSLTDPQVSYRLDGFDTEDTTVSRSKLNPVDYTNLTLGVFHFLMKVKDPVGHTEQQVSFQITKGKEISAGAVGTFIMDLAALLLMGGMLICTIVFWNPHNIEDRILISLFVLNTVMAAAELMTILLEYYTNTHSWGMMTAGMTVFYICLVFFPYQYLSYLHHRIDKDPARTRKKMLLYGIPCFLFCALMIINLKTGWIFSIDAENNRVLGFLSEKFLLPLLLVLFYFLLVLKVLYKVNGRMTVIGILLLSGSMVLDLWSPGIRAASFIYAVILTCILLYVLNEPVNEVAL